MVSRVAILCVVLAALLAVTGCYGGSDQTGGSTDETSTRGTGMGGPAVDVNITPEVLANKPKPPVLTTPQDAVRSYIDWVSYAYRTAQSEVAEPVESPDQAVRDDAYIQYNVQKLRLIDQTLDSITFGTAVVKGNSTLLPAKENWTYRYVSVKDAGKTLEGPLKASYDTTYTVIKQGNGNLWVVNNVEATPIGEVK